MPALLVISKIESVAPISSWGAPVIVALTASIPPNSSRNVSSSLIILSFAGSDTFWYLSSILFWIVSNGPFPNWDTALYPSITPPGL